MIDLEKYFRVADTIIDIVGNFLIANLGTTKTMFHKTGSHYGIQEDLESNRMYASFLEKKTPEIALYTEEGERNLDNELVWVIDPIEGTSNYRTGNPFFATQLALLHNNEPVLGIVYAPVLKQKFHAKKGSGASLNSQKIHVSDLIDLDKALVDMGRGTRASDKEWFVNTLTNIQHQIRTNRTFGVCGLGLSYCAAGITDVYMNSGSHIYDFLPGSLIIREAGGKVVNFKGEDWTINDDTLLASNEELVNKTLKIL